MQGVLLLDGEPLPVRARSEHLATPQGVVAARDGDRIWVHHQGHAYCLTWRDAVTHLADLDAGDAELAARAPMPGTVIAVAVVAGDRVSAGDPLVTIESMKLETVVRASRDAVVEAVLVAVGSGFERDALLVQLAEVTA